MTDSRATADRRVTIVTNAFNQASFLPKCLDSVLSQSHRNLEYIVVDPGSSDGTADILADYERRWPGRLACRSWTDDGPADGLNRAFAEATGEIFAYLNADDFLLPGAVAEAVGRFENPDVAWICGNGFLADLDGRAFRRSHSRKLSPAWYATGAAFTLQQSTFYRASAFRAAGGFNARNKTCWDAEILVDMHLMGFVGMTIPDYLGVFTIHPDSITGSGRLLQAYEGDLDRITRKIRAAEGRSPAFWVPPGLVRRAHWLLDPRALLHRVVDAVSPLRADAHMRRILDRPPA